MTRDTLERTMVRVDGQPVEWRIADGLVPYAEAVATMEARAEAIARGEAREIVWLVEHPPLYTAGTSAGTTPTLAPFPVFATGRGGQLTYHGPGQRVAYAMLDLQKRQPDLRVYVAALERWIIETLAGFAIHAERREDRVGVWVRRRDKPAGFDGASAEDKIAAIGIRVRRWVTFHGFSLNVDPDLSHYRGIVPCGITQSHYGVTSLADLGQIVSMSDVDAMLKGAFKPIFGETD